MIALLKQNRCVVYKDAIKNWMQANRVLSYVRSDLMSQIVVNWVTHVLWAEQIFESVLVDDFVFKNFNKYV